MKKNSKGGQTAVLSQIHRLGAKQKLTVGLDLGDRSSRYWILDEAGETAGEDELATTPAGLDKVFAKMPPCRVALEVGTHSPWVSRHLAALGHEVIVANPRKVRLITQSTKKTDRMDAEQLARLARVDPKLLSPIRHRGPQAQADLAVIRARAELVEARTKLINAARGLVKPMGERLKSCDADTVREALAEGLSEAAQTVIRPLLKSVEEMTRQIKEYEQQIRRIETRYSETKLLKQVYGVGTLVSLAFVLTLEQGERFAHSRDVGPYLGLTRKMRDSGASRPQLGISKAGDELVRRLLVQAAHCILRKRSPESDLKIWGLTKAQGGNGKPGSQPRKKKAVVAVARKLAVLLHHLWVTGDVYDPEYNRKAAAGKQSRKAAA
jgi:transposase